MVEIETERLLLRPIRPDDLAAFHAILSDATAMAFWSSPPHQSLEETAAWLDEEMSIASGEGEDFAVVQGGQLIGKVGLYRFPEIGFIFHPDAWGRGYAREALELVIDRAFSCHGLPEITADVDPRNEASLRLLKRLGFQETGRASRTWHIAGQWCDSVYLRLTAPAGG